MVAVAGRRGRGPPAAGRPRHGSPSPRSTARPRSSSPATRTPWPRSPRDWHASAGRRTTPAAGQPRLPLRPHGRRCCAEFREVAGRARPATRRTIPFLSDGDRRPGHRPTARRRLLGPARCGRPVRFADGGQRPARAGHRHLRRARPGRGARPRWSATPPTDTGRSAALAPRCAATGRTTSASLTALADACTSAAPPSTGPRSSAPAARRSTCPPTPSSASATGSDRRRPSRADRARDGRRRPVEPAGDRAGRRRRPAGRGRAPTSRLVARAHVLGRRRDVDPDRTFKDLGFDSLTAVELRDRLGRRHRAAACRRACSSTTPPRPPLAGHLRGRCAGDADATGRRAARRDRRPTSRSPSSAWPAATPAGSTRPRSCGGWSPTGRDAIGAFPDDRGWDLDALYDPDPDRPARPTPAQGGFLHDAAEFDAAFFGISPREALAMDPQQRLLLETLGGVRTRPGIDPAALRGSRDRRVRRRDGPGLRPPAARAARTAPTATCSPAARPASPPAGSPTPSACEGPAVTVDTACSSSLVALHLAAQALRHGRVRAGAGRRRDGDGRPRACSWSSAGSAGCRRTAGARRSPPTPTAPAGPRASGMLLLERLSDARRNGHRVLAVVRGSAVNQDGASQRPDRARTARAAAGDPPGAGRRRAAPADVDAVEAHGTGTTLGDPIEAQALLGHLRPGPRGPAAVAGLAEVQHRPHPGRRGRRRRHQDGRWRCAHGMLPAHPARRRADARTSTGRPARSTLLTEPGRWPETDRPRRAARLLLRDQRHQRPRDPRAGARAARPPSRQDEARARRCPGCCPARSPRRCARRPRRLRGSPEPTPTLRPGRRRARRWLDPRAQLRAPRGRRRQPTGRSCWPRLDALARGDPAP